MEGQTWWLYLLLCQGNKTYAGTTTDVEQRFLQHLQGKGARYTRINKPLMVLGAQSFPDRSTACKSEFMLKQLSQQKKLMWAQAWPWNVADKDIK